LACELASNWLFDFTNHLQKIEISTLKKAHDFWLLINSLTFFKKSLKTESLKQQKNRFQLDSLVDF